MISQGSIYLIVRDFDESVHFYKLLFERDVTAQNMNRFAIFNINGLCLSIMNGYFDSEHPDKVTTKGKVYKEYDRICALGIGSKQTEIRYINARNPYYYFSMKDPDDNTIEITGPYDEIGGELK